MDQKKHIWFLPSINRPLVLSRKRLPAHHTALSNAYYVTHILTGDKMETSLISPVKLWFVLSGIILFDSDDEVRNKHPGKGGKGLGCGGAYVSVWESLEKQSLRERRELSFTSESCRTMLQAGDSEGQLVACNKTPACSSVCLFV